MSDLEAVLNGEPFQPQEVVQEPVQEPEQPTEQVAEGDLGNGVVDEPTGEQETSTPEVETKPDPVEGFKATALAERQKRQAAEQQLRHMQEEMQKQQPKPDFWENPEGILDQIQAGLQAQIHKTQTDMSVELMRTLHDDYNEKEAVFIDMAQKNPILIHQMNQSSNPAKYAYDYVTEQQRLAEMKDPGYKDKLRAEIRAELEAEFKAEMDAKIEQRSSLPGTLSKDRAAGGNKAAPYQSPALTSILPE